MHFTAESLAKSMSTSSSRLSSLSPRDQVTELSTSSFNYHHEFSNSGSNLTKDDTSLFKKALLHKWHHKHSILCMVASPKRKLLFCGTQNSSILVLDLITFQKKLEISTHVGSVLCLHLSSCEDILFSGGSDSLVKLWMINDLSNENNNASFPNEFLYNSPIQLIPTHTIYSLLDVGDIFSITWIEEIKSVFIGAQNASLSFVHIDTETNGSEHDHLKFMPSNRFDRFFDSQGPKDIKFFKNRKKSETDIDNISSENMSLENTVKIIQVPPENIISYAHNGYLYAIDYIKINDPLTSTIGNNIADEYKHIIVSAGGDGEIKLWGYKPSVNNGNLTFLKSLSNPQIDSIFSLVIDPSASNIYVGSSNGNVYIWDLTTFQLLKIFQIDSNDVYAMALSSNLNKNSPQWLLMGTESGITKKLICDSKIYNNLESTTKNGLLSDLDRFVRVTKDDPCLTLKTFQINNESYLVSAGSDRTISLWSLKSMDNTCVTNSDLISRNSSSLLSDSNTPIMRSKNDLSKYLTNENFLQILSELISFRSVSKQPDIYMAECRKCANYLTVLLKSFGAFKTQLLPVTNGNPIVHAIFKANSPKVLNGEIEPTRILWYGHYDVIPASQSTWKTPPFTMTPQDGYLYARGVTDNKGPLLVSIFAIAELYSRGELESDVIFLIEGEEESGSWGFQNVILENQYEICDDGKSIDWILLSNSYWLDDDNPALNYGLRGKLEIQLEVWSDIPDRHSGVDGGVFIEPSMDLVKILSNLVEGEIILIPGFKEIYKNNETKQSSTDINSSNIQYLENWEIPLYKEISERLPDLDINELIRKWRLPSLTLHKIEMSGPDNDSVISQKAEAKLSIRIIPSQELEIVKNSFIDYVNEKFNELNSKNHIEIKIMHEAEPWLGNVNNSAYKTLMECLKEEWGVEPILVREGGSIPSIRFLEKVFSCSAVHIPTGQASDNAHLNNERVRIVNLLKSKEIIKKAANLLRKDV
jgi:di- and tripeptidase